MAKKTVKKEEPILDGFGSPEILACQKFIAQPKHYAHEFDSLSESLIDLYYRHPTDWRYKSFVPAWKRFGKEHGLLIEQRVPEEERVLFISPRLQLLHGNANYAGEFLTGLAKMWQTPDGRLLYMPNYSLNGEKWIQGSPSTPEVWVKKYVIGSVETMPCVQDGLIKMRLVSIGDAFLHTSMVTDLG